MLDPGVEARRLGRLLESSGRLLVPGDGVGQSLQVFVCADQSGAPQQKVAVIGGYALGDPQPARVVFAMVIERSQSDGTNSFNVPMMKVFVRFQSQEVFINALGFECSGRRHADV